MKAPLFVRPLTEAERQHLEAGLRSKSAFTLRRCQILLASAQGQRPARIASNVGCASQTVRNTLRAFRQRGLDALCEQSHTPTTAQPVLDAAKREQVQAILHQSPRTFNKNRITWTLPWLAQVCQEAGRTERRLSAQTMRDAVLCLCSTLKRAKHWITTPDSAYTRK